MSANLSPNPVNTNRPLVPTATTAAPRVAATAAPAQRPVPMPTPTQAPPRPSAPAGASASASELSAGPAVEIQGVSYRFPLDKTLRTATKLSLINDKAIHMDYWTFSLDKTIKIGINAHKERYLIKSDEEYTSMIVNLRNVESTDIICETENSIYIIAYGVNTIQLRSPVAVNRISAATPATPALTQSPMQS